MPLLQADIIHHHPFVLRKVREGSYRAFKGEKHIATIYQEPEWKPRLAGWWQTFPPGRGAPGPHYQTLEEILEDIHEFDTP